MTYRNTMGQTNDFVPPPHPPPLLSDSQIVSLAHEGHLAIPLSHELTNLYSALSKASANLFSASPAEKATLYPSSEGTELGYITIANEKEYLTLRAAVHPDSELEQLAARVWHDTAALLRRILVDLARGLNLPDPHRAWSSLLDGCLDLPPSVTESTPALLRLFQYLPNSGLSDRHTDLGLLTLCVGAGRGLQVLARDGPKGQFRDVEGPTVLIGETLRALSGERVRAGVHRVVANPEGRSSIVFALRASLRHEVDMALFGGEGTLDPKDMWNRIKGSKVNINATHDVRERQRQDRMKQREKGDVVTG